MRKNPTSSSRIAVARMRSRVTSSGPSRVPAPRALPRSLAALLRSRGSERPNSTIVSNFSRSRWARQCSCRGTACVSPRRRLLPEGGHADPCGSTRPDAGGIASVAIRSSTSGSSIRSPSGPRYSKPRPRRRRLTPGAAQLERRSLGTDSYARARVRPPRLAALLRLAAFRVRVRAAFFAAAVRFSGPWRRRSLVADDRAKVRHRVPGDLWLTSAARSKANCLATFLRTPRARRLLNRSGFSLRHCSSSGSVPSASLTRNLVATPRWRTTIRDRAAVTVNLTQLPIPMKPISRSVRFIASASSWPLSLASGSIARACAC